MHRNSNSEKLIISIYDFTGQWAKPYIDAGYPVMLWDKKIEGDILTEDAFKKLTEHKEFVHGLLAAPPCTDFAGSGARWWTEKDKDEERINISIALVQMVMILKEQFDNLKFWVLENPVGRLEKLIPELKQFRKLLFNPCDYGDPYTKKTILYGEFNHRLRRLPVLPLYGSMMHLIPPSEKRQEIRSSTPGGFAKAFFEANK